jgi:hypothetical protein
MSVDVGEARRNFPGVASRSRDRQAVADAELEPGLRLKYYFLDSIDWLSSACTHIVRHCARKSLLQ